ncbi:MAG: hypothetical protein ACM3JI_05890, partial [Anaerolineae bacterium]
LELLILRCQKGIADNDALIRTNFGFIDGKAVQIDVGPFSKDSQTREKTCYSKEIVRITTSLKHWLEEHFPELLHELNEQLDQLSQ